MTFETGKRRPETGEIEQETRKTGKGAASACDVVVKGEDKLPVQLRMRGDNGRSSLVSCDQGRLQTFEACLVFGII